MTAKMTEKTKATEKRSFEILVNEDITGWDRDGILDTFFDYKEGRIEFIGKAHVASLYNTFLVGVYTELTKIVGLAAR